MIAQPQVKYLVYVLSGNGVTASADKVKAVKNYASPQNVRDVKSFRGRANFLPQAGPQ